MSEVRVKGLAELEKALNELPLKFEKNIVRGALRAGAKVVRDEARALAPVAPPTKEGREKYGGRAGLLRDSIRVSSSKVVDGRVVVNVVAGGSVKGTKNFGGGAAFYARWVEFGTKPHMITVAQPLGRMTRRGWKPFSIRTHNRMLHRGSLVIGQNFVGPVVMHPGAVPNPFMRPALDNKGGAAIQAIADYIRKRLATKHGLDVPAAEVIG